MAHELEKPFVDITRRAPNYPLFAAAGVLAVCAVAAIVLSVSAGGWISASLVAASLGAFGVFAYLSTLRAAASGSAAKVLNWRSALPEVQQQSLEIEVSEIARTFDVEPSQTSELYMAYIVAEDLALRQVQEEQNAPLLRHVQAGRSAFDALIVKPGEITCVEFSFLVTPVLRQDKIDAALKKTALLRRFLKAEGVESRVKLLLVLVTQLTPPDEAHLLTTLGKDRFIDDDPEAEDPWLVDYDDIEIQLIDFEALQRRYLGEV